MRMKIRSRTGRIPAMTTGAPRAARQWPQSNHVLELSHSCGFYGLVNAGQKNGTPYGSEECNPGATCLCLRISPCRDHFKRLPSFLKASVKNLKINRMWHDCPQECGFIVGGFAGIPTGHRSPLLLKRIPNIGGARFPEIRPALRLAIRVSQVLVRRHPITHPLLQFLGFREPALFLS